MKTLLFLISTRFLKLVKIFSHNNRTTERKFFGLGQFVLLLTLAPFIFNLSLYSFDKTDDVPSHYQYNPDRFESLPLFPAFPTKPTPPRALSKQEYNALPFCNSAAFKSVRACIGILNKNKTYKSAFKRYRTDLIKYREMLKKFEQVEAEYGAFKPYISTKPQPLPPITIKQHASRSYSEMLGGSIETSSWQKAASPAWFLGLLLILPTIWLCIRRQQWGLLAFGLSAPAFNYVLFILVIILGWDTLSSWQINSSLIPKIAFLWFALRGSVFSKSFGIFVLLMAICALIPVLIGEAAFHPIKAQFPLLVFLVVAAIARLLVKGARENFYLLKNLGWARSLRTGLHAIVLWLPMALLAIPFFYVTEIVFPKHMINHLHAENLMQFNHEHDILDNTLQSTAVKADDALYAWHLTIEDTKRDIYSKSTKLESIDLKQKVEDIFDNVMPPKLEFDKVNTGVPLIGWAIDIGVKASQKSTAKAFDEFRNSLRKELSKVAADNDKLFKDAIKKSKGEALQIVNKTYEQGRDVILETNRNTQTTFWWTINYIQAAHQLTLLLFAFICMKSFMYVFARVSFNRDTGTFVTLGNTQENIADNIQSLIKPTGQAYLINGDADENFYISRRFQCRGKAPRFKIPQPFHAPIARFFNGAYTMNKIEMHSGDDQVSCTAAKGIEFFEWNLADGETVVLDFHYFVGMSESIKISTLISPRISSLLLGKMIYSQLTGPGKLILMAKGRAEIVDGQATTGSLPPERLIAMNKNTRLHIDSELDPLNIYLSTAYVRPAGGGKTIVDVDSQRGSKTGLGSFVKHFLLPI